MDDYGKTTCHRRLPLSESGLLAAAHARSLRAACAGHHHMSALDVMHCYWSQRAVPIGFAAGNKFPATKLGSFTRLLEFRFSNSGQRAVRTATVNYPHAGCFNTERSLGCSVSMARMAIEHRVSCRRRLQRGKPRGSDLGISRRSVLSRAPGYCTVTASTPSHLGNATASVTCDGRSGCGTTAWRRETVTEKLQTQPLHRTV